MESTKNQREVEERLRDAVKQDRARIQIGRLSRFGLLEMSRQRLRPSLGDSSHVACPRCQGVGTIRSVESMALAILRLAGEDARKERTGRLIVQVPISVATYLVNEKRAALRDIEEKCGVELVLVPNKDMETPEFSIRRVRHDELGLPENSQASFKIPTPAEAPDVGLQAKRPPPPQAAVTTIIPTAPAPAAPAPVPAPVVVVAPPRRGLLGSLKTLLFGDAQPAPAESKEPGKQPARGDRKGREERGRSGHQDRDVRRGGSRDGRDGGDRPRSERGGRDRNRGRDTERRPAQPRSEAEAAAAPGRGEPRSGGGEQRPRREPAAKPPENQAALQVQPGAGGAPENAAAPRADGEKRSRRGGRRRRGRGGRGGEGAAPGGMGGNDAGPADDNGPGSHGELDFRPTQEPVDSRPAYEPRGESNSPAPTAPAQEVRVAAPPPPPPASA